ncbi:MAG: RHS repeat-associated core domain-containing protein [Saprospiraceae bacterium]|nr:RHS repeat-associated core domain-containing protein [Saprospiraceae bacterium]
MNERKGSYTTQDYRYGYNGKENDNEVKGESNQQDYGFRVYDPRVGRFLSVDPLVGEFASWTSYHYVHNNPMRLTDPTGMKADTTRVQDQKGNWKVTDVNISRTNTWVFNNGQIYTYNNELHFGAMSLKTQSEINKEISILNQPTLYQIGFTGSASSTGVGGLFSLGYAWDSKGNKGLYFTLGTFAGLGGGLGLEYAKSTSIVEVKDFNILQLNGFGQNTNVNAWYLNASKGGNASNVFDLIRSSPSSYKSRTVGLSTFGYGLSKSYEYTYLRPLVLKNE